MIKIQCFLKNFLGLAPQSKKLTTRLQTFPTPTNHVRGKYTLIKNLWTTPYHLSTAYHSKVKNNTRSLIIR